MSGEFFAHVPYRKIFSDKLYKKFFNFIKVLKKFADKYIKHFLFLKRNSYNPVPPAFFAASSPPKNWESHCQGAAQKFRSHALSRNFLGQNELLKRQNNKYKGNV